MSRSRSPSQGGNNGSAGTNSAGRPEGRGDPSRQPPRRRRAHAAQPEDGRVAPPASWASPRSGPATGSPSTTTRTRRSSSTSCAGSLTAELDGEAQTVTGRRGALHPDQRQAPAQERGQRGRVHRLPPRPARAASRRSATSTPRASRQIRETKRRHRGRRRRAGRRQPGSVLGAASRPAGPRRAGSRSSTRRASARRSPPSATSTRARPG